MTKEEAHAKLTNILAGMIEFCDDMNYDFSSGDIRECMEVLKPEPTFTNAVSKLHIGWPDKI